MNHQFDRVVQNIAMDQNCERYEMTQQEVQTTDEQKHPAKPKGEKIKRPMNAFMVWSKMERRNINELQPDLHNSQISKQLGFRWQSMSETEKAPFRKQAEQIKIDHMKANPGYVYRPERKQTSVKRRSANDENSSKQPKKKREQRPTGLEFGQTNQNTWNQFHHAAGSFYNNPYGMAHNEYMGNRHNYMPNMPPMAEQMANPMAQNAMLPMQINFNIHYPNYQGYPVQNNSYGNSFSANGAPSAPNERIPHWNAPAMAYPSGYPDGDANNDLINL